MGGECFSQRHCAMCPASRILEDPENESQRLLKPEGAEIQQLNFYRGPETHKRRNPQTRKYGNLGHARHPTTTNARNLKMFIRAFRATGIPRSGVSDGSIDSLSSETAETACSESQNRRFFIFVSAEKPRSRLLRDSLKTCPTLG